MSRRPDWIVFYADGREFSSEDGPPEKAPAVGVEVVLQRDPRVGVEIVGGHAKNLRNLDGYWIWKDGRWFDSDTPGFWDYMFHHDEARIVLFGRWMLDDQFEAIVRRAREMGKSSWKPHERR